MPPAKRSNNVPVSELANAKKNDGKPKRQKRSRSSLWNLASKTINSNVPELKTRRQRRKSSGQNNNATVVRPEPEQGEDVNELMEEDRFDDRVNVLSIP